MTGKTPEDVTEAERPATKAVNFGLLFGAPDRGLAEVRVGSTWADVSPLRLVSEVPGRGPVSNRGESATPLLPVWTGNVAAP